MFFITSPLVAWAAASFFSTVKGSVSHPQREQLWSRQASGDCVPADPMDTVTDRINSLLNATTAAGYSLKLCPSTTYIITAPLKFSQPNQEITTLGFPGLTLDKRAIITVGGTIFNGTGHTTAIDSTSCATCDSATLRYVQINGNRSGAPPTLGGANIEMGGNNRNQVIEFVRSYDPRSWSCMHIAEGGLPCSNATVQNNDIGPCGTDDFQQWADGISLSCRNSLVQNNVVIGATDGGIVIFGSPGSRIHNNTIMAKDNMLLGGINMVDYDPWAGDYTDTVVENNHIMGGFATDQQQGSDDHFGINDKDAFIKIGLAMGPRTWFGDRFGMNETRGAMVRNNDFSGAFGYAMAAATVNNFTVTGNVILSDTTFIGSSGPNCSTTDVTPPPEAFVFNASQVVNSNFQSEFVNRDADSLNCILPDGDDYWPYMPTSTSSAPTATGSSTSTLGATSVTAQGDHNGSSPTGLIVGVIVGIVGAFGLAFIIRSWYMRRLNQRPDAFTEVKSHPRERD